MRQDAVGPRRGAALFFATALIGAAMFVAFNGGSANGSLLGSGVGIAGAAASPISVAHPPGSFAISGGATGLYPGLTEPLSLTISNPQHFDITVTSITAAVGDANANCRASMLTVAGFAGTVTVPALSSAQITTTITLLRIAPDGCQGAAFPLTYSGTALKDGA